MGITDIFSKRQRRLRGEFQDVYQYTELPKAFRIQFVHILRDVLGHSEISDEAKDCYQVIHDNLARELGLFRLDDNYFQPEPGIVQFLLNTNDIDDALSVIEYSLLIARIAHNKIYGYYSDVAKVTVDDAITELNTRFLEHGIGYQFESNAIVRLDSQFLHQETVIPALKILMGKHYTGANTEFLKAHEHYRHQRYAETINECLKALESTLKVICKKRHWSFPETATVNILLRIIFEHELVPSYLQSNFSGLRSVLESGVPTIRNREGGHGTGAEPRNIPQHFAAYTLHLTASAIVFLSQCDTDMKRNC